MCKISKNSYIFVTYIDAINLSRYNKNIQLDKFYYKGAIQVVPAKDVRFKFLRGGLSLLLCAACAIGITPSQTQATGISEVGLTFPGRAGTSKRFPRASAE